MPARGQRAAAGLLIETNASLDLPNAALSAIEGLIAQFPLERFKIQGLLEHDRASGIVRFTPALWEALRFSDTLLRAAAQEQLAHYYGRYH